MTCPPSQLPLWKTLHDHQASINDIKLCDLFAQDTQRFSRFSRQACGFLFDFSKNHLTDETLDLLLDFAREVQLPDKINAMFQGDAINHTESRAAFHVALRAPRTAALHVENHNVSDDIHAVLAKMQQFSDKVRTGSWRGHTGKPIENIVNIGIGGSDLGPAMVTRALRAYHHPRLHAHYVSNVDVTHLTEITRELDPETTLFIIASKTFTTQETLLNAYSARDWLLSHFKEDETAIAQHFVALSTNTEKVCEFGINPDNMFEFWDWVGGRYSVWSAVGLSVMIMIGAEQFQQFLAGAHQIDEHFRNTEFSENIPVLMGLISVWYSSFHHAPSHAILPYDFALEQFPAYLQQLIMESLGKSVTESGAFVDYLTCPIIWGATGNNGQHAFYQLLHQGTQRVPCDVLVAVEGQYPDPQHQTALLSNALAQAHVFMMGRDAQQTADTLRQQGLSDAEVERLTPHRTFRGNQPSNTLIYQKLSPKVMGQLIALYEHKTFVQSVCWGVNPFDQWGVELGKQVASSLLPALNDEAAPASLDQSTAGLLSYIQQHLSKEMSNSKVDAV